MPITAGAIKKMRQDLKREAQNKKIKNKVKELIKKASQKPTTENIRVVISAIDRAAKKHVFHRNRAARLKSKLAKLVKPQKEAKIKHTPPAKTKQRKQKSKPKVKPRKIK